MGDAPGEVPCRGCGSTLAFDAQYCSRCGRSRNLSDATLIELLPNTSAPVASQSAVLAHRPPDRRRALSVAAGVAGFALIAFGVAKVIGGGDDRARADAAAASSTTQPTAATTSTSLPPVTTGSATTSAPPAPTSTIPYVNQRVGLVLDEAQRGRLLYVQERERLYRVDLATGAITMRSGLDSLATLTSVVGDRVYFDGPTWRTLGRDMTGELVPVAEIPSGYGPLNSRAVDADGTWLLRVSSDRAVQFLRIDRRGTPVVDITLPRGIVTWDGVAGDRVVVSLFGRIFTVGADGALQSYASGQVVAVAHGFVLWIGCDDAARCTYRLGTAWLPDSGRARIEVPLESREFFGGRIGFGADLAPDARTMVVFVDASPRGRKIVDLETGSTRDTVTGGYTGSAWTPDGAWFLEGVGFDVVATNVRTGEQRRIAIPGITDGRDTRRPLPNEIVGLNLAVG